MSYLEQSTRYIAYDARLGGRYRFYRDPAVLASRFGTRYVGDMDRLFDAYSLLLGTVTDHVRATVDRASRRQRLRVPPGHAGQGARRGPRRAAGGVALQRRHLRHRPGVRGAAAAHARPPAARGPRLRRADAARAAQGDPQLPAARRPRRARGALERLPGRRPATARPSSSTRCSAATPVDAGRRGRRSSTGIPTPRTSCSRRSATRTPTCPSTSSSTGSARSAPAERLALVRAYVGERENRRHKPGRAFERIDYRFDVLSDYGAFRDLQRHRLLTIEWQRADARTTATCAPSSSTRPGMADVFDDAMAARPRCTTRCATTSRDQATYAVSMAYRMRYVMQFNAREAIHLLELRSAPQGHPAYRRVALEMHRLIAEQAGHRAIAEAMTHMTTEAPELERLEAERRAEAPAHARDGSRCVTVVTKPVASRVGHRRLGSGREPAGQVGRRPRSGRESADGADDDDEMTPDGTRRGARGGRGRRASRSSPTPRSSTTRRTATSSSTTTTTPRSSTTRPTRRRTTTTRPTTPRRPRTKRRAAGDEEEDEDDDMLSPDDVEADLDTILKDRLVTAEDDERRGRGRARGARRPRRPAAAQARRRAAVPELLPARARQRARAVRSATTTARSSAEVTTDGARRPTTRSGRRSSASCTPSSRLTVRRAARASRPPCRGACCDAWRRVGPLAEPVARRALARRPRRRRRRRARRDRARRRARARPTVAVARDAPSRVGGRPRDATTELPIDDYESLAASQVVDRLPTLTPGRAGRGARRSRRRTAAGARSSGKIDQLLA